MQPQLGATVRDKVTGYEGIATAHAKHLTGCDTLFVVPKAKDGKMEDGNWIDIDRLEVAGKKKLISITVREKPGGMPLPAPR